MKLVLDNISKEYKSVFGKTLPVLKNISFSVEKAEIVSLLGPTGCGKTTLLKIIAGLESQTAGEIKVYGIKRQLKAPIVWQEHRLLPWRTVLENVRLGLELQESKESKNKKNKIVKEYLKMAGLEEFEAYYPHQISGGMKQRVALLRSICIDYDILLLDEPLASLDFKTKEVLRDEIKKMLRKLKKCAIYVTHDIVDAVSIANKIILLTPRPGTIITSIKKSGEDKENLQNLVEKIKGIYKRL